MARKIRKVTLREVPLSELKNDFSRFLRESAEQEIVITRHGKPAGVLVGFACEDDWFDYRLENDPRFLSRIAQARQSLRSGQGVKLEDTDFAGAPADATPEVPIPRPKTRGKRQKTKR